MAGSAPFYGRGGSVFPASLPGTERTATPPPGSAAGLVPVPEPPSKIAPWIELPPTEVIPYERNFRAAFDTTANTDTTLSTLHLDAMGLVLTHYGFWAEAFGIGTRGELMDPQELLGDTGKPTLIWLEIGGTRAGLNLSTIIGADSITNARNGFPLLTNFLEGNFKKPVPLVLRGPKDVVMRYRNVGAGADYIKNIGFACMGYTVPLNYLPEGVGL